MPNNLILVYMDTCIISRVKDQQLKPEEAEALNKLGRLPNVELVTSKKVDDEISNAPDPKTRNLLLFVSGRFKKIPYREIRCGRWPWGHPRWGQPAWGQPGGRWGANKTDSLYNELSQIFEANDAEHIFQATKNNCNYFMTLDNKTILKRVKAHNNQLSLLCPTLQFGTPSEIFGMILQRK